MTNDDVGSVDCWGKISTIVVGAVNPFIKPASSPVTVTSPSKIQLFY